MRSARLAAAAALAFASLAAPPAAAVVLDAATIRAVSGQVFDGFIVTGGDTHAFLLEDFAPQAFGFSLKAAKGSALLPDITLRDPANADITSSLDPFRSDGAKSVTVKNAVFASGAGRYVLRVTGKTATTGEYLLKVTAKVVKKVHGSGLIASGGGSTVFPVFAPTEALVSLKVVPASGSTLVPLYGAVTGDPCVRVRLVPGLKPGTATFSCPVTGAYSIGIDADGGTAGAFNWSAKVKPAKPSRKPVRVNGGAAFFPGLGPAPASKLTNAGQSVVGWAVDGATLCWREVRTSGGGPNLGKNSVSCATLTGKGLPGLANNFATDAAPDLHAFALGSDDAVAVAAGELFQVPRGAGNNASLDTGLTGVLRLLADGTAAYVLQADGIRAYPFAGGGPDDVSVVGGETYRDMAFGGSGLVFAVTTGGGDLEVRMVGLDGSAETALATLSPDPGFHALTARGPDAYFTVDDGNGDSMLFRASACDPGTVTPMVDLVDGVVDVLTADDLNVYGLQAAAERRLLQVSRGGGEATVLLRENTAAGFDVVSQELAAAGGFVFLHADDGSDGFWRVKRR